MALSQLLHTDTFFDRVLELLTRDIRDNLPELRDVVIRLGQNALRSLESDLKRWNLMLAAGSITAQEYEWLVGARVALIQVESLKIGGLALVKFDRFRASLIRSIVGAAISAAGL